MEHHAQSGLMFAAIVRLRPGIPSTLNAFCVSDYPQGTSPHLWGFPNYEQNTIKVSFYGEPDDSRRTGVKETKYSAGYYNHFFRSFRRGSHHNDYRKPVFQYYNSEEDFSIVSAHHSAVDNQCNRLFTLDSGALRYSEDEFYRVQNPALIVFHLPSNGCTTRQFPVVRRVEIPDYLWSNSVGYNVMTVDHQPKGSCDDIFVYFCNAFDNRVLVYDFKKDSFWNIEHSLSMTPIMSESYMIFRNDYKYQLPLGVTSIGLGFPDKQGNRLAYYSAGSSLAQYAVSTKYFKNPKKYSYKYNSEEPSLLGYRGCGSQAYRQLFDHLTGVVFFAEMQSHRLSCWNPQKPLNPDTVGVIYESEELDFISGLFVDTNGYLWFHSSQVPIDYLTNIPLDLSEINSQVFRIDVYEAIKGTVCEPYY